jgi:putative membrane protein
MRQRLSAFLFVILIAISTGAIAQTQPTNPPAEYYWPAPWHMWGGGYGGPMWWMFPMMILFFLGVCAVVFFFARGMCGMTHHWRPPSQTWGDPTHSALQILNERFARGEIQKEEYVDRKAAILKN